MKKPNPGRKPPEEQRTAAEAKLRQAAEKFYTRLAELEREFHAAVVAAARPPQGVEASENKSLVTRHAMVEITKAADPRGKGLSLHGVQAIVHAAGTE
ncbi:hypothetical protein F5972_31750 [Microbispora cellulosiformans]|uniref:Uncharacterized protein n=1 Tax=Microbispora cellulosiformans TaxID=2614688 RepID=A0A5J5JUS8_9ACTN|nr:hypothetical protein [Microbispora cellulosiformans]KAA9374474.1 hypothetical protein F5972_31750 [Microbispora cellulosiformans]